METEKKEVMLPASVVILLGIAIGIILFIVSTYVFPLRIGNRTLRTIGYLLISFPLPVSLFSFAAGYKYPEDTKDKTMIDLLIITICGSIVFTYAIIQASPGELWPVVWKSIVFVSVLFGSIYLVAKKSFQLGLNYKSDKRQEVST